MATRLFAVLGVLLCALVLISSRVQVAAEEATVAEEQKSLAAGDAVHENKQVHGCDHGCCSWFRGRCVRCCRPETTTDAGDVGDNKQVHGCDHGCCSWFRGRCVRCCRPETTTDANNVGDNKQVHGCDHGCCSWFRGRCVRCCHAKTVEEAVVGENKNHKPPCRCCSYFRRRCTRCCAEGEAAPAGVEAEAEVEGHN